VMTKSMSLIVFGLVMLIITVIVLKNQFERGSNI
jgi:hypothetical protein